MFPAGRASTAFTVSSRGALRRGPCGWSHHLEHLRWYAKSYVSQDQPASKIDYDKWCRHTRLVSSESVHCFCIQALSQDLA